MRIVRAWDEDAFSKVTAGLQLGPVFRTVLTDRTGFQPALQSVLYDKVKTKKLPFFSRQSEKRRCVCRSQEGGTFSTLVAKRLESATCRPGGVLTILSSWWKS